MAKDIVFTHERVKGKQSKRSFTQNILQRHCMVASYEIAKTRNEVSPKKLYKSIVQQQAVNSNMITPKEAMFKALEGRLNATRVDYGDYPHNQFKSFLVDRT